MCHSQSDLSIFQHPFLACYSITSSPTFRRFLPKRKKVVASPLSPSWSRLVCRFPGHSELKLWSWNFDDWQCLATVLRNSLRISSFPVSNGCSNIPSFLLTHIVSLLHPILWFAFFLFKVSWLYPLQSSFLSSLSFWKLQVQDLSFALSSAWVHSFLLHLLLPGSSHPGFPNHVWSHLNGMGPSFGRSRQWQFYWPVIRD